MRTFEARLARSTAVALLCAGAITLWPAAGNVVSELSRSELTSIASAVDNAINNAKAALPAGTTRAQIDAAEANAISSETRALISQYPNVNAMILTEVVITSSERDGATAGAIGQGMANAALAEGSTIGLQIADAVGATAPRNAVRLFETITGNAGTTLGSSLAEAASSYQGIVPGRNGNGTTMNFSSGTGTPSGGTGGGGCKNPSCT